MHPSQTILELHNAKSSAISGVKSTAFICVFIYAFSKVIRPYRVLFYVINKPEENLLPVLKHFGQQGCENLFQIHALHLEW